MASHVSSETVVMRMAVRGMDATWTWKTTHVRRGGGQEKARKRNKEAKRRAVRAVALEGRWESEDRTGKRKLGVGARVLLVGAVGAVCAQPLRAAYQTLVEIYQTSLVTHPVLNKSVVSMLLFSASDLLAQFGAEKKKHVDVLRLARMAAYAALIDAPLSHHWYQGLDQAMPASTGRNVLLKVALSQVVWEPIIVSVLVLSNVAMRMQPPSAWVGELKQKLVTTIKVSWKVWPAIHVLNFCYIPPSQRVAFCSLANLIWVAYLSVVTNKQVKKKNQDKLQAQPA